MKLSDFPLEFTTDAEHPFPYINQWIKDQFPYHGDHKQFLMFLSLVSRGEKLDQAYIIKYPSQFEETMLLFFITLIAKDNVCRYSIERELPGMTWIKDADRSWADDAVTFKPWPILTHDIFKAAKEWEAFVLWLQSTPALILLQGSTKQPTL